MGNSLTKGWEQAIVFDLDGAPRRLEHATAVKDGG